MDEMFETLTLIQTGKSQGFPVIIMGTDYWHSLFDFVQNSMMSDGTISADDLDNVLMNDDCNKALQYIQDFSQ